MLSSINKTRRRDVKAERRKDRKRGRKKQNGFINNNSDPRKPVLRKISIGSNRLNVCCFGCPIKRWVSLIR